MFKLVITKADFDALDEGKRAFYRKDEKSDNYLLDLDPADIPDVTGLKNKVQELLDEKKTEQQKREQAERDRAKAAGDITALEASWQTRLDTETTALRNERDGLTTQLQSLTVGRTATEIAADLAVVTNNVSSAKALMPHIERRLAMETKDGQAVVRVLDANGKPSAMTVDQLKDEFRNDPVFAPLIRANDASGGGGDGNKGNGGGKEKPFAEMNQTERAKLYRENPTKFKQLADEHKKSQPRQG